MSRSTFDAYNDPLFKKLGILNLNLERIYKLQIYENLCINTNPAYFLIASIICFLRHARCILMVLGVWSFFIYHNAGLI